MDAEGWNARYREGAPASAEPVAVLRENAHLLPRRGRALEPACGLGANSLFLAQRGFEVTAWDFSVVAIRRLRERATGQGLTLSAEVRDVVARPPAPESAEVIVVSRFLDRSLIPHLTAALVPGGLLFYQTFVREAVSDRGPSDPAYRLAPNELLRLFASLHLLFYREEGRVGDLRQGFRDEAMLVGQKR